MKYSGSVLAVLIAVSVTVGDGVERTSRPVDALARPGRLGAAIPEPPNAPVLTGDRAPDFAWISVDNRPRRLRDILEQASVLMVFAPSDEDLRQIENEREELGLMGVVPVVVADARARAVAARARRTGVHFIMVPDPLRVIASQYNVLDAETGVARTGWFAVDRRGIVRGAGGALSPRQGWTRIVASALAIPAPDVPLPARTR